MRRLAAVGIVSAGYAGDDFSGERFRRVKWLAVRFWCAACYSAALDVCGSLRYRAGAGVWFCVYGTVRKKIAVEAQTGMLVRNAMAVAGRRDLSGWHRRWPTSHMETRNALSLNLLLMAAGGHYDSAAVCFTGAATRRLSTLGFSVYRLTLMFYWRFMAKVPGAGVRW